MKQIDAQPTIKYILNISIRILHDNTDETLANDVWLPNAMLVRKAKIVPIVW